MLNLNIAVTKIETFCFDDSADYDMYQDNSSGEFLFTVSGKYEIIFKSNELLIDAMYELQMYLGDVAMEKYMKYGDVF